jgi:hypothetical protein
MQGCLIPEKNMSVLTLGRVSIWMMDSVLLSRSIPNDYRLSIDIDICKSGHLSQVDSHAPSG